MAKFYLFEEQSGGCDYTIGCGFRLRELEGVTTMDEAVAMATAENVNEHGDAEPMIDVDGELKIDAARILQVVAVNEINLSALFNERYHRRIALVKKEREQKERKAYEELKKKYG